MNDTGNRLIDLSVYITFIIFGFFCGIKVYSQDTSIRIMTFNIRYDNPDDGVNSWKNRKSTVTMFSDSSDIFGMQEVLLPQLHDIWGSMSGYRMVGVGREDGKTKGEYAPVFYKTDRFRLLDQGTFWLSPTPLDTGSVGWDAALTRICTWGKFLEWSSGLEFYFLNTHFDHIGDTARAESARLILDFIEKETNDLPVILTGDFNSSSGDVPYSILTNAENGLFDACRYSSYPEACLEGTFNGFGSEIDPPRIDMVFFKGRWEVESYEVLKIKEGEMFISDHWPVVVQLKIKN
jgi:endonuclease/exonuclease/phosphatase family metal-dependent hydrolase